MKFVKKWLKVTKQDLEKNRKKHKKLVIINESDDFEIEEAA